MNFSPAAAPPLMPNVISDPRAERPILAAMLSSLKTFVCYALPEMPRQIGAIAREHSQHGLTKS